MPLDTQKPSPTTRRASEPAPAASRLASFEQIPTSGYPPAPPAEPAAPSAMDRMSSLGGAAADSGFRADVARGLADVAGRTAANVLGGPVDLAALALRPLGYQHPAPLGGSEWIGQGMESAGMVSPERRPAAEAMATLIAPGAMVAGARGLSKLAAMGPSIAPSAGRVGASAVEQLGAISPEGKARLLADLQAGKGSGTYRLGDVTQGQANALQRLGTPPGTGRDVVMTDAAHQHLLDARIARDNFSPEEVVQFAKQAMEPRSVVVRDPTGAGHKAAIANEGLLDPMTKRRYTAQMPLKAGDGGLEVVSVIPRGLSARKTKAPE